MAEATPLEQTAKTAPQQKAEEQKPKPVGTLESVVNETTHFGKTLFNVGLATAIPTAQALALPIYARDTAVMAGAQVAGDATTSLKRGKKFTSWNALESAVMGATQTIPAYHMFDLLNKIPTENAVGYLTKGSVWGGIMYPLYIGMYQFLDYTIKNRTFKGLGSYMKKEYWPALKNAWKYVLPISLFNIFLAPPSIQLPIGAFLSYLVTLFGAPKRGELKEEEKRDKTPYLVATSNVTYKLARNTGKGLYDAVYAIGSGLRDTLYKTATKTPAPATATTPQPA